MRLIRRDKSFTADPENPQDYCVEEYGIDEKIQDGEMSEVKIDFKDFGRGSQRRPNFAVKVNWLDVQIFMRAFIEMGHPDALYLQRLIKLDDAVQGAGWHSEATPREGFFDILPSN